MDRDRALALLNDTHRFPGPFEFRFVIRPADRATVLSAVVAAGAGRLSVHGVDERPSRTGAWIGLHVGVTVEDADTVLGVWEAMRGMPEIKLTL